MPRLLARPAIFAILLSAVFAAAAAEAQAGHIAVDARSIARGDIVPLDGSWRFHRDFFDDPSKPQPQGTSDIAVPGKWLGPPTAAGTYHLTIACERTEQLSLYLPVQRSAVHWFANGIPIAQQGTPSLVPEQGKPEARQQIASVSAATCPVHLVAHVSNAQARTGGLVRSVEIGSEAALLQRREAAATRDGFVIGALALMALLPLAFFATQARRAGRAQAGLLLAALVVTTGLMATRLLSVDALPVTFDAYQLRAATSWYSAALLFTIFLRLAYPEVVGRRMPYVVLACAVVSMVVPGLTHGPLFRVTEIAGKLVSSGLALYLGWRLIAAWRSGRRAAGWLLLGYAAFTLATSHDLERFEHLARLTLAPYGALLFAAVPAFLLARRFTRALAAEQRLQVEETLAAERERLRTEQIRLDLVVRGAQVGIVDWDGVTHETWYSPQFRVIRGYPPDADTADWPDYFKVLIHPDDRVRVTRRWVKFIKGLGPEGPFGDFYAPEEYRLLRADGSHVWVRVSGMAVRDGKGFVTRWIAAVIDISAAHAQEEQLRQSRDQVADQAAQLEAQNEALKENVRLREEVERIGRHDLKTPLNSILAVPRLLREERHIGPEADELLGIVERAGYRILSMVNLSLDLYKMEQGTYAFRPDVVDLVDLADKVVTDLRAHAASKQVQVVTQLDGAPRAWAEELLCYSLLANLMKNAVEASPTGGTCTLTARAGADDTVVLEVHNEGAVPAEIRGSFFQKYMSLGKASGTGLGTYSARLMARVQDGDVVMRTSDEEGTVLAVTLRAAAPGAMPVAERHAAERRGVDPRLLASLPPTRVLLVDDDEYNLLIVRRFLPSPPFEVACAINGRVALSQAQSLWPGLVFMDLDMPVMGGMEAVREFRALQAARGGEPCTIIALSSHDDEQTRSSAIAAGFDRYLTKPVTREVIQELLLALHGSSAAGLAAPPQPRAAAVAGEQELVVADGDLEPVFDEFMQSRRELVVKLVNAAGACERAELRRIAHQLAGSFALYGFGWASEQATWVERNAESGDPVGLQEASQGLARHLDRVKIAFAR